MRLYGVYNESAAARNEWSFCGFYESREEAERIAAELHAKYGDDYDVYG